MNGISTAALVATLSRDYGLSFAAVERLSLGNDADACSFRIRTAMGGQFLLRLRRDGAPAGSLRALVEMADSGVPALASVVAPLFSRDAALAVPIGGCSASLFPYIEAANAMEVGLPSDRWVELGHFVRALHGFTLPVEIRSSLPVESFVPVWAQTVRRLDAWAAADSDVVPHPQTADRPATELARFWRTRREEIVDLLAKGDSTGRSVRKRGLRTVLCHADIHTANVLVPPVGPLRVVDWDGILYAPVERDLMFVPDENSEPFYRGYGRHEPDPLAVAYYRLEWAIQEIGDYGRRIVPVAGEIHNSQTRVDSFEELVRLFEPGRDVDRAYQALAAAG